jgi:hypothetical protein
MAKDSFEAALDGFRTWASAPGRSLAGEADADARELEVLFGFMPGYLGVSSPAELRRGHIEEMLLDVYPRKVVVERREDTLETLAALRDFLAYLDDSRALDASRVRQLLSELENIGPEFADAVMEPANWGPGRALMTSMLADGVDMNDPAAVDRWIVNYNAKLESGLFAVDDADVDADLDFGDGDDVDFEDDDEYDELAPGLKELFGLPDEMPPMRLPDEAELVVAARSAPMISRMAALATWAGDDGRPVDEDEELPDDAIADAAAAVGVDSDELRYLYEIAYAADWIDLDEDDDGELRMFAASTAEDWAESHDDEDILMCWDETLEAVLTETLLLPEDDDPEPDIDFEGHGMILVIFMFMLQKAGVTRADIQAIMREGILGEQPLPHVLAYWNEWIEAHGHPADVLLDRLVQLAAVDLPADADGPVYLTSLGLWALRRQLIANDVEIPLLPPAEEMSAVDLLSAAGGMDEDEFDAETGAWLASRDPLQAARELLTLAAVGEPADRVLATGIASRVGEAAEPAWRDVLTVPELASYAKVALTALAGGIPGETDVPGLELAPSDMAWMTTDVLAIFCSEDEEDPAEDYEEEIAGQLAATIPPGQEAMVFDLISRGSHPEAVEVLTMIGQHHPDKKVAKEARKCAYKAATRRASPGASPGKF